MISANCIIDFLKYIRRFFMRLSLSFLNYLQSGSWVFANDFTLNVVRNSGILKQNSVDNLFFLNRWDEGYVLFEQGKFREAKMIRINTLHDIYSIYDEAIDCHLPSFYSREFTSNFGHLAHLIIHSKAQDIGELPYRKMYAFQADKNMASAVLHSWAKKNSLITWDKAPSWTELPVYWPLVERFQIYKAKVGFREQFEITEKVFSQASISKDNPMIELDQEYCERAKHALVTRGLKSSDWFVTLHVREGKEGQSDVRRFQSIESFRQSCEIIQSLGGWIVRIGDNQMSEFKCLDRFVDLTRDKSDYWMHPYVLSNALFHLGTNSGPSMMSAVFGTPTIVTNVTSIARSMLTSSKHSFYIPKKYIDRGKRLSFSQQLNHEEGYSELNGIRLKKKGIQIIPNTSEEIREAVEIMFKLLDQDVSTLQEIERSKQELDKIRKENNAVSFGAICPKYMEKNHNWFLGST